MEKILKNDKYKFKLNDLKKQGILFFKEITEILDYNCIEFWIEYGSLLGATRNQEIIPWDSEFDLGTFCSFSDLSSLFCKKKYIIKEEPDRLKIRLRKQVVGIFTVDIHLHKVEDEYTKILFGSKVQQKRYLLSEFYSLLLKSKKK